MISPTTPRLTAIPFDAKITKLTERFTGREWVFEEIDNWLKHQDERFFILTGEPGVGKSAIAAHLTQKRNDIVAYHFCRAGDVETVRPGRVLRSLAAQMGEHLLDYGQALANTIKPVHLRVEVNINIGSMTGSQVTGVYIENLKESDPANELDILIRAPLAELQKMYMERQQPQPNLAIILIDSLDEAVTTTGTNLVELLTQLSKSPSLPPWVKFILTSRPERRVLRGFEPLKPYHLRETSNESLCDISSYIKSRVELPVLQGLLQVNQVQPKTLISEITSLSKGNFLYTKLLLNDIEAGQQALDNLAELPKSIDEIYHGFLCRFSEDDWRDRYKPIFGVLTVAKEPISEQQISRFTNIFLDDVRDNIRIARQFFDIDTDEQNKETYSIFHQSFRDYLLDEERNLDFWCNALKQHQQIVDYCWKFHPNNWQECDRYGLRYLTLHLVDLVSLLEKVPSQSKKYLGMLHELLSVETPEGHNIWFEVKDSIGDAEGYLSDVRIAWKQADYSWEKFDNKLNRESAKIMSLQCRYALIISTMNSLASIPAELSLALIKQRVWTLEQGLAYARQVVDPEHKVSILAVLAENLPTSLRKIALKEALGAVQTIRDEYKQPDALAKLTDQLPPELLHQALVIAQAIENEWVRARALALLADKLSPELLPQFFSAVQAIEDGWGKFRALAALAGKSPEVLPQALAIAKEIKDEYSRSQALIDLVNKLPLELLQQILTASQTIKENEWQAEVLAALAGRISKGLLPQVQAVAQTIGNMHAQYKVLAALSVRHILDENLSMDQLIKTLSDTQGVNQGPWANALATLAYRLPKELLPQALSCCANIKIDEDRVKVLTALAGKLTPELLPQALAITQTVIDKDRVKVLTALAGKLTPELLPQALAIAQSIEYSEARARALIALADQLPELLPQALAIAQKIEHDEARDRIFSLLVDKLEPALLVQTLNAAQTIGDEEDRAKALVALAEKTPGLWPQALTAVQSIENEYRRSFALKALANKLPDELLPRALYAAQEIMDSEAQVRVLTALLDKLPRIVPQALTAVQSIENEAGRSFALADLAEKFPLELLPQALEVAKSIQGYEYRTKALASLANKLPEILPEALAIVQAIKDEFCRLRALTSLVDKLPTKMLSQALAIVQGIQNEWPRSMALTELIKKLTPELVPQVLSSVQTIQNDKYRADVLIALTDKLPMQLLPPAFSIAEEIATDEYKSRVLAALANKLPQVLPDALATARAVRDEFGRLRALAALTDKLPVVLPEALAIVQMIENDTSRSCALNDLADKLPPKLLPQALCILQAIKHEDARSSCRSHALATLASKLPPDLLPQALEIAQTIEDEWSRSFALTALFPQFIHRPIVEFRRDWLVIIRLLASFKRPCMLQCLGSLAPILVMLGGEKAITETATGIEDVCRWWN
jgi:hypothetical protein